MTRRQRILLGVLLLSVAPVCSAATIAVTPTADPTPEQVAARAASALQSTTTVTGRGDRMVIRYSSPVRIDMDLAPQRRGSGRDPSEIVFFTLPPGADNEATVDLTATPGWSPLSQTFYLDFFSPKGGDQAEVKSITFLPVQWGTLARVLWKNLLTREHFQVATFHALRGPGIFGYPLAVFVGVGVLLAAAIVSLLQKRKKLQHAIVILALGTLIIPAWFTLDLARFTVMNLRSFFTDGTYSEAGPIPLIAASLQQEAKKSSVPLFVEVCNDTTDFQAKMLRYQLYPTPVSVRPEDTARATHVVAMQKRQWTFVKGILTCGALSGPATKVADFPGGAALFASVHP